LVEFDLVGAQRPPRLDVLAGDLASAVDDDHVVVGVEPLEDGRVARDPVGGEVRGQDAPADRDDYLHWRRVPPSRA
jgi:hypothetical protein